MKTKVFTTILGLAVFAIPAAVPASQPADVRMNDLTTTAMTIAPSTDHFATLLRAPQKTDQLSVDLVTGYTTLEWINQDPFAL